MITLATKDTYCKIVGGPSKRGLFLGLELGHESRLVEFSVTKSGESLADIPEDFSIKRKFHLNSLGMEDGSGNRWMMTLASSHMKTQPDLSGSGYYDVREKTGYLRLNVSKGRFFRGDFGFSVGERIWVRRDKYAALLTQLHGGIIFDSNIDEVKGGKHSYRTQVFADGHKFRIDEHVLWYQCTVEAGLRLSDSDGNTFDLKKFMGGASYFAWKRDSDPERMPI